jgi:hypothetical protein
VHSANAPRPPPKPEELDREHGMVFITRRESFSQFFTAST